jgi:hypothetical protein
MAKNLRLRQIDAADSAKVTPAMTREGIAARVVAV